MQKTLRVWLTGSLDKYLLVKPKVPMCLFYSIIIDVYQQEMFGCNTKNSRILYQNQYYTTLLCFWLSKFTLDELASNVLQWEKDVAEKGQGTIIM